MLARSNGKLATCVLVFSVEKCTNPAAVKGQSFGYSTFLIDANINHVDFDLPSGTFTVKTAGNFQMDFNALVSLSTRKKPHRFDLKINGETKAVSVNHSSSETRDLAYQPVVISALVSLKIGEVAGIYASEGKLYQDDDHKSRFSAVLFFEQSIL